MNKAISASTSKYVLILSRNEGRIVEADHLLIMSFNFFDLKTSFQLIDPDEPIAITCCYVVSIRTYTDHTDLSFPINSWLI